MTYGYIKRVQNDFDDFIEVKCDEIIKIERKIYLFEWRDIIIEFMGDFVGILNIIFVSGRRYNFNYRNVSKDRVSFGGKCDGRLSFIYFEYDIGGSFKLIESVERNLVYEVDWLFLEKGYKQFYLSQDLIHLRSRVKNSYGLEYINDALEKTLFFGIYNRIDIQILKRMEEREIGILWGGSDIMLESKLRSLAFEICNQKNFVHFAMSKTIFYKLKEFGFDNIIEIKVSFCWNDIKYKFAKNKLAKKGIYIYDGMDKNEKKKKIYNQDLVDILVDKLKKYFDIYRSSDGFKDDIIKIYEMCFISLRLTEYDGNANSAQECGMLGIPVISNQDMNHCISWNGDNEEIERKVWYIYENRVKIKWEKDGVNLIFISGDEPGRGGGATFTFKIVEYLRGRGFNIIEIYLVHIENKKDIGWFRIGEDRYIIKFNQKCRWNIYDWLEKIRNSEEKLSFFLDRNCKIILRCALERDDIKKLLHKFEVKFFIPGIFINDLDCNWKLLKDISKYFHIGNLKNANMITSYANSELTQSIFYKYGFNNMKLLEINFLQLQKKYNEKNTKNIDFLFVVSNTNRKIKNTNLFVNLSKEINGNFMIISADKIEIEIGKCEKAEGIKIEEINNYYRRAKCLINCSYFDSMSNVVLEAIENGCHILISENNGLASYIEESIRSIFVVEGYNLDDWKKKMEKIRDNWNIFENQRNQLWNNLKKKSYQVEIDLLSIMS